MPHEAISVFDMFKIGVGPSSSHTLGPWRAALRFLQTLQTKYSLNDVKVVQVLLYGSLAKTGKGHGTDVAVILGLSGEDPVTIDVNAITPKMQQITASKKLLLNNKVPIDFDPANGVHFLYNETLPFHPNGLTFLADFNNGDSISETFYSVGGGFVVKEGEKSSGKAEVELPFPVNTADELLHWCMKTGMSINEVVMENENASFGRVVTAPTNGAAGVIPAILQYYVVFCDGENEEMIITFLLTASEVGSIFKKGATISAAMGGCQAEIGVSSAMAAAALTEVLGATQRQALMAAEIAMEHHLGLTCDPIGGLVQVPCIERNTMGAIKAITASQLALQGAPDYAKVSLDKVIKTMWDTALDMNSKYKETSEAGLAVHIPISLSEC